MGTSSIKSKSICLKSQDIEFEKEKLNNSNYMDMSMEHEEDE